MQELLALAANQFGLFTRAQAHRCGVTDRMLRHRVETGMFVRLARGIHRVVGSERSWEQRVLEACLCGGPRCVASHRTAAALFGLHGSRRDIVEVTVPRSVRYKTSRAIVHQSLDLEPSDCTMLGPIPVTTPARTLIDLGAVAAWPRIEEAFDAGERDNLTTTDIVSARHSQVRRRGRRGAGAMAVVLHRRGPLPPTELIERRFLRLLERDGLPSPECQFELALPNGRRAFLDAAYVAVRLGFEIDGHGSHATRTQRAADNTRAAMISDLGWTLRRFTYEQIVNDGAAVALAVRTALESRSCGL